MWPRFLALLLLFVSCVLTQAISSLDVPQKISSERTGVNPSNRDIVHTQDPVERNGTRKDALRLDAKVDGKYNLSYDSRTKRGRGVYGGANVNHRRRRSSNSAATLLRRISTVSLSLPFVLLFLLHLC